MKPTLQKWAAIAAAGVLCLSLTGCLGHSYVNAGTIDGEDIPAGLYLEKQLEAYNAAKNKVEDTEKSPLSQEVEEGVKGKKWIEDETEKSLRKYICVQKLSAENEVFLTEDDRSLMQQMEQLWDYSKESDEENGIKIDTRRKAYANTLLSTALFQQMYGEEGEKEKSDAQLKKEYGEAYAHLRYIRIPLAPDETEEEALDEEALDVSSQPEEEEEEPTPTLEASVVAEVKKVAEKMQTALEKGESMEDVAEEYLPEAYEVMEKDYADDDATISIGTTYYEYEPSEEDADKDVPPAFLEELKKQKVGTFGIQEKEGGPSKAVSGGSDEDPALLVYEVIPTFETDEEFENMRTSVLQNLYGDEFEDYLESIYSEYEVKWIPGARAYLSPSNIAEE